MTDENQGELVLTLLRNAAESRRKTARAMLDAYAANALPNPATPEDIATWTEELADAENELIQLSN